MSTPIHTDYELLTNQAEALMASEQHPIANAANLSALIFSQVAAVNWAGFYFTVGRSDPPVDHEPELLIGPFQGLPACIRLPWGRGVCGTAAASQTIQRIDDVHAFDGHIACDSASRSELVVPLLHKGQVLGVLDIDSPHPARFSEVDAMGFEQLAQQWLQASQLDDFASYAYST